MNETSAHWAYTVAERLADRADPIVIAAGVSPSGSIHVGNLREAMTADLVNRALVTHGRETDFLFSWDDYDRFRKVPANMPRELQEHIGKPLNAVPDVTGRFDSYATRVITEFESALGQLGINPRFIRQSEMYADGKYTNLIQHALSKREEIAHILAERMTQGMTEEQIQEYYPLSVYSRFTGKDNTRVLGVDGTKVTYLCHDTGERDTIDIDRDASVKLPWKTDWPMRWLYEGVDFEPGGPDHAAPGSSYDVSSVIARQVFGIEPPLFEEYGFIGIKGGAGKMSSSSGEIITPDELLRVYTPEVVRYLYARPLPKAELGIALDTDVLRVYAEFDELTREDKELVELIRLRDDFFVPRIPFRKVFGLGEATRYNIDLVRKIVEESGERFDSKSIEGRLQRSDYWSSEYYPEGRHALLKEPNTQYYQTLNEEERAQMRSLRDIALTASSDNRIDIEDQTYLIAKREGMSEQERKKAHGRFFRMANNLLFGSRSGPRLPTFLWASKEKERIARLLVGE